MAVYRRGDRNELRYYANDRSGQVFCPWFCPFIPESWVSLVRDANGQVPYREQRSSLENVRSAIPAACSTRLCRQPSDPADVKRKGRGRLRGSRQRHTPFL